MGIVKRDLYIEDYLVLSSTSFDIVPDKQYKIIQKSIKEILNESGSEWATYKKGTFERLSVMSSFNAYIVDSQTIDSHKNNGVCFAYYANSLRIDSMDIFKKENAIIVGEYFNFLAIYNLQYELFMEKKDDLY